MNRIVRMLRKIVFSVFRIEATLISTVLNIVTILVSRLRRNALSVLRNGHTSLSTVFSSVNRIVIRHRRSTLPFIGKEATLFQLFLQSEKTNEYA